MTYAFVQDVPADEHIYEEIRTRLGDEPPKGLVAHLAMKREGGLRYVDVWDTREDWDRFREERVEPTVKDVLTSHGIPVDDLHVHIEDVEVIDTWLGDEVRG